MDNSLFSYLMHEAPQIRAYREDGKDGKKSKPSPAGDNTKTPSYVAPVSIRRWRDFDLRTLITMYSKLLRNKQERPEPPSIEPIFTSVWNELSLGDFIHGWNSKIVCQALKETQELRGQQKRLWMVRGHRARKLEMNYAPDWAAISTLGDTSDETEQQISILPGDTKISTKWNFTAELEKGTIKEGSTKWVPKDRPQWFKPLAQIFSYCYRLRVRYGYLITDKELLAVRIGPGPDSPQSCGPTSNETAQRQQTGENGILEFATVQWDHGGQRDIGAMDASNDTEHSKMSVNLALWWLHLLAEKDRSFQWEYGPLDQERLSEEPQESGVAVGDERSSERVASIIGDDSALRESMTTIADDPILHSFDAYRSQISESSTGETSRNRDEGIQGTGKRKRQTMDQTASKKNRHH